MDGMDAVDKKEGTELTAEERAVLGESLARLERIARRWRYGRYLTLCLVCILYFNGFRSCSRAYKDAMTPLDKEAYIEKLSSEPIPTDVTARYWIVGYVNKIAVISACERKYQSATMLSGIIGAIMLTVAVIGTVLLFYRWNDGERMIVMVKVIRGYVHEH
jgi:hypothetical protein